MSTLTFAAQFTATKLGATGLTVTIDIKQITRATGAVTAILTGGSATEVARGLYRYTLTGADLSLYDYLAVFITSDATVDLKEVPAAWVRWAEEVPDVTVGGYASGQSPGTLVLAATADGLAVSKILECLMAVLSGVAVVTDDAIAFKKRDGTTTSLTITYGNDAGERTASVIA